MDERNDAMKVRMVMGSFVILGVAGSGFVMLRYPWLLLVLGLLIGVMLVVAQLMGALLGWGPGKTEGRSDTAGGQTAPGSRVTSAADAGPTDQERA
jgi:hypothetical protein